MVAGLGLYVMTVQQKYKSCLRWPGGKSKAIKHLAPFFPKKVDEFRDICTGGGSFYFYAKSIEMADHYWINDKYKPLIDFYQIVQNTVDCSQLMDFLYKTLHDYPSSEDRKRLFHALDFRSTSQFYRAYALFCRNRMSFSGCTEAGGFSPSASMNRFNESSVSRLAAMPEALAGTHISNYDWFEVLTTSTRGDTFCFIDPPYLTASKLYGKNGELHSFDHKLLADVLRTDYKRFKFLVTYDDCPEICSLYDWAYIYEIELPYGMGKNKKGAELVITNYKVEDNGR